MADRRVLIGEKPKKRSVQLTPDTDAAWKWVGWVGLALALAGGTDLLLVWYPTAFGRPEWEFATLVQTFAGLPLVSIGFAGVLGGALALGRRWLIVTMAVVLLVGALVLLLALMLFLTDVPLALRASEGLARTGIKKAVFKTLMLGVIFGGAYGAAGVAALRHMKVARERT